MGKVVLKGAEVKSIWKVLPLVFVLLGLVIGIFSFIYLKSTPTAIVPEIGFFGWVFAILLYAVVFAVIMTLIFAVGLWLYNLVSSKMGGVALNLSSDDSSEE